MMYDRPVRRSAILCTSLAVLSACGGSETEKSRFDDDGGSGGAPTGPTTGVGGIITTGIGGAGGAPTTTSASGGSPVTTSSSGAGMPCNDPGPEPNDGLAQATYLGTIDDCDSSVMSFSGVLGDNDVDWFEYDGTDVSFCSVNPSRTITADAQVRLCKYPTCVQGTPEFTCPAGTSQDSTGGLLGCCSTGEVSFGFGCSGTISDDATVYLRIDKPSGFSCVSYSVSFHY